MSNRKSICILALSPIVQDGRVLRQIEYLAPHYDLTVVGFGSAHPFWSNYAHIKWVYLPQPESVVSMLADLFKKRSFSNLKRLLNSGLRRLGFKLLLLIGQLFPPAYATGYALLWTSLPELKAVLGQHHDAYHANDWNTLPFAALAARRQNARLVVDLHEYAPLEFENQRNWWLHKSFREYLLRRYAVQANAVTTVASLIAERYALEFGFKPSVVMNAPEAVVLPPKKMDPNQIRIVHHGVASPVRKPELMIRAIALADLRYSLHFMFMPSAYLQELKKLAVELAPGRVFFHAAVPPEKIVETIAEFDIGFNFIAPTNYNYRVCLPNKFFESIVAGLAICTGPSPSMAEIVEKYGCGVVSASFAPEDLAAVLNQTTAEQWSVMQQAAREAAKELNAAHEMQKVVQIYQNLFAEN